MNTAKNGLIAAMQPAIDQRWFDKLRDIDNTSAIVGLSRELWTVLGADQTDIDRSQRIFNKIPFNPDLRNKSFNVDSLDKPMARLRQLRQEILDKETNVAIAEAYVNKIDEVLLHNELLVASVRDDKAGFMRANLMLYGGPSKRLFKAECAWLHGYAQEYIKSPNQHIRQHATAVTESVPLSVNGNIAHLFPSNAVFKRVRGMHYAIGGYFETLFGNQMMPDFVTAAEGDPMVRSAVRTVGANYDVADSDDGLWGVIHHKKQIVRPPNFHLPREEFVALVAHEIGSHLLERCNGRRQPLRLLEIGLDRYEAGNEGRAFMREQLVHSSPYDMQRQPSFEYLILKHFAISLGFGLTRRPYTFRELYEAILPVCSFFQILRQPDNPVYAHTTAQNEAWHVVTRVLKGTDGNGGAYLKDIVYLEGNIRAWKAARRNPAIILFGDNGKFDIARADHIKLLADLGLKPDKKPLIRLQLPLPSRPTLRRHS